MGKPQSVSYLRFLARWDRDEDGLRAAVAEAAQRPVELVARTAPSGAGALFHLFGRDPLDASTKGHRGEQ